MQILIEDYIRYRKEKIRERLKSAVTEQFMAAHPEAAPKAVRRFKKKQAYHDMLDKAVKADEEYIYITDPAHSEEIGQAFAAEAAELEKTLTKYAQAREKRQLEKKLRELTGAERLRGDLEARRDDYLDGVVEAIEYYFRSRNLTMHRVRNTHFGRQTWEEPLSEKNIKEFTESFTMDDETVGWILDRSRSIDDYLIRKAADSNPELAVYAGKGSRHWQFIRERLRITINELELNFDILNELQYIFTPERIEELLRENPRYGEAFARMDERAERERRLRENILSQMPDCYADLYPAAREMERHFILHIGPTNCGKTHDSIEAFKKARRGVYLGPLRLLAFEIYENANGDGVPCNLVTGEEEHIVEGATHQASTVEMMDPAWEYDVAVIDEAQMMQEEERGGSWTAAIMGVLAKEVHVCAAPYAEQLLIRLIEYCGDTWEVVRHERMTPLIVEKRKFSFPSGVRQHDALIVFSKKNVLAVASELQARGVPCSIIYGALPYEVRQQEVRRFIEGETRVVVATDAIGMGMNLPVQRIVFLEMMKYDGHRKRDLYPEEVLQIAGRAGRYGIYDTGYTNAEYGKAILWRSMRRHIPDLEKARLAFPEGLIGLEGRLSEIMERWNSIEDRDFFQKAYTVREIELCRELEEYTDDKELIYRFVMIPFDESDQLLKSIWEQMFAAELAGEAREFRDMYSLYGKGRDLQELEELYSVCDLVYYYCRVFNHPRELDDVAETRNRICSLIIDILKKQSLPGKRCRRCGKILPWNYPYGMCEECFGGKRS